MSRIRVKYIKESYGVKPGTEKNLRPDEVRELKKLGIVEVIGDAKASKKQDSTVNKIVVEKVVTELSDFEKAIAEAAKKEADELVEKEKEDAVNLYNERKALLMPFWEFMKEDHLSVDFGALPQESFDIILKEVEDTFNEAQEKDLKEKVESEKAEAIAKK